MSKTAVVLALLTVLPLAADERDAIAERGPLKLSLKRAIELAVSPEGNPRVALQTEAVKQAQDRSRQALGTLLPDVETYVGATDAVRSLAAQGLTGIELPFGLKIPQRTPPYHTLDLRATMSTPLFDFSLVRRLESSHASVKASKDDLNNVDDTVVAGVSRAYLTALRADADVAAAQADVALAQATKKQSINQKQAGSGTAIDVTRSDVELSNQQQRLLVSKNQQTKAHLQLLRVMNLRLDTEVELTDKLEYRPVQTLTVDDAIAQAKANRSDLQAQLKREDAARLNASAVKYERLPSVIMQADYGTIGPQEITLLPTRDLYAAVRIPVFDGGRRDARRAESYSQLRQEQIRTADLRDQIELDVRTAMDSLRSADEQVLVAKEGLRLAESELQQARRRYDAGVAIGLEITDASTRMERARTNDIQAVYNYNLSRIDLGQALGKTASMLD